VDPQQEIRKQDQQEAATYYNSDEFQSDTKGYIPNITVYPNNMSLWQIRSKGKE